MRDLFVFGAGGLGSEAVWVAEEMGGWRILGFVDDDASRVGKTVYGHPVIDMARLDALDPKATWFHCAIGKNDIREKVTTRLEARGFQPATLVHPNVARAKFVTLGDGTYVAPGVVLSPNVVTGRHALVNQRVSLGHDAVVEDFTQCCPGAQINAFCRLEKGAFVGSNASIHQGRKVGAWSVVGANAQVIRDVAPKTSVAGVPAQLLAKLD